MKKLIKKSVSLLCALALLLGMCAHFALAAGNPVYSNIDNVRQDMGADLKIMTFNILEYNNSSYYFQFGDNDYNKRFETVVASITAYDADVVGIQEAASSKFDWPGKLISRLGSTYGYIRLDQQSGGPSSLNIARGLIIFYKKARFSVQSNGCQQFKITVSNGGYNRTDDSRWFQWAKLRDKNHNNQDFYFFNTHFAIGADISGSSDANDLILTKMIRTEQARILSEKIHSLSANLPFFATGDYNCPLTTSESDQAAGYSYDQLCRMNASPHPYIMSAMRFADLLIGHAESSVDHIFTHTSFVDVLKLVGLKESTKGITASDHFAYVAYCNYRANAQVKNGKYDKDTGTHTDLSDGRRYAFSIVCDNRLTYKIYDGAGNLCSNTVELKNTTNVFEIRFYAASGALYDTIKSTIRYTGADKPILQVSGAVNHYFANGAYQVAVARDTTAVAVNFNRGTLYSDAACTRPQNGSIPDLPGGRTALYLKTEAEVFPVYIYKETFTASTDPLEFYVDDDIGNAVGTVAFWNGSGVCLIKGQIKGFDSLLDLQAEVNKGDGRILNVAPGDYEGPGANTYNSSVTILGPNNGRSPHIRYVDNVWVYNAGGRLEEAVIHGDLRFTTAGSSPIDRITVKGLKFVGEGYWGSICLNDVRKSDSISPQGFITKLDISYNIFEGWGTQGNAASVWANTRVQKTGIMEHNWFNAAKHSSFEGTYARAVFMRNINGLVMESNRFSNYDVTFFVTSEITVGDTTPGYLNLTVSGNRFEYCDRSFHYFRNLYGGTTAHLKYLDNTFVRCGFNSGAFYLDLGETSAACGNNYAKCSLEMVGNRFFGCGRSVTLYRRHLTDDGTTSLTGDLSQMTANITQNVFYDPLERPPGEGFAGLSGPATASINFCFVVKPNGAYGGTLGSKWKLSHNYFYSARLALDYSGTAVNNPDLYCCNYYSKGTGDSGKSFGDSGKFAPYYTAWANNTFTALSSGSIQNMNVTVSNYNGAYDGQPHTITVTAPAGATVAYSTNATGGAGAAYQSTPLTRTEVGTTKVGYRVTCPGYTTVYGTASITITKGAAVTATIPDKTVTYNGKEHHLAPFTSLRPGDTLRYLYGGAAYETMPAFYGVGVYNVGIEVTNPNYNTYSKTATLTILPASLEDVEISGGYEGVYDGNSHNVCLGGLPDGVLAEYALDGGEWSTIPPVDFKEITDGPHTVTVRLSGRNYLERTETLTFNILPATITGVTLTAAVGLTENGNFLTPVTLTGAQEGDTVRYSVNGGPLQATVPTVTRAGRYTVAAVITRTGHTDKTLVTDVTVAPGTVITPAVFAPTLQQPTALDTDGASFRWTVTIGEGEAFSLAETADFKVLAYGLYHAGEREHLEDYIFYARYGKTDQTAELTADGKITETTTAQSDTGLTALYAEYALSAADLPPMGVQYTAFFIRFEIDGVIYEQYSEIQAASALPGGIA